MNILAEAHWFARPQHRKLLSQVATKLLLFSRGSQRGWPSSVRDPGPWIPKAPTRGDSADGCPRPTPPELREKVS